MIHELCEINENLDDVLVYFNIDPRNSISEAALELNTSHIKVIKFQKKHNYISYKIHKIRKMRRLQFCNYLILRTICKFKFCQ